MRALVADSSAPGRIALRDVPEPVPAPGEVHVEVREFSLTRGELRMLGTAADGWAARPGLRRHSAVRRRARPAGQRPSGRHPAKRGPQMCG
jgi:hypothetical protein